MLPGCAFQQILKHSGSRNSLWFLETVLSTCFQHKKHCFPISNGQATFQDLSNTLLNDLYGPNKYMFLTKMFDHAGKRDKTLIENNVSTTMFLLLHCPLL